MVSRLGVIFLEVVEDFLAALSRAQDLGGMQEINQEATDLGVKIAATRLLADPIRTIIGFEVRDNLINYTVSQASLVDQQEKEYKLLGVHRLPEGGPFPWFMEFEPLHEGAEYLMLTIEQLQSHESDSSIPIKIDTLRDPWDPQEIEPALIQKLYAWREELQAPSYPLPPTWECMGKWKYTFAVNTRPMREHCQKMPCYIEVPLLQQNLKISSIMIGFSGSMLTLDSYPQGLDRLGEYWKILFLEALAKARDPLDFGLRLDKAGLDVIRPMFFKISLRDRTSGKLYPTTGTGPWGAFNTRFYYLSDWVQDTRDMELRIEEVFNLYLEEYLIFELNLREKEQEKEIPFSINSPFVNVEGIFRVSEIFYDVEYLLVSHDIEIFTGNISHMAVRDIRLVDRQGQEYIPLSRSTHLKDDHGIYRRGTTFPPVHYQGSLAFLVVRSIDIAPRIPYRFDLMVE